MAIETPAAPIVRAYRRSALEAAACLHRYHGLYVQGVEDQGDEARRGIAFHLAAELYIRRLVTRQSPTDWGLAQESLVDAIEACLLPAHLVPEVEWLYTRWAERFELDIDAYLESERALLSLGRFSWRPDLVYVRDEVLEIVDWKTHWVAWTQAEAYDAFQSRFYLLMAAAEWPNQPRYRLRYVFVRLNIEVVVEYDATELPAIERQVSSMVAVVEEAHRTQTWPATSGPHCAWCRLDCPINGKDGRAPIRLDDRDEFREMAAEYLALQQRLKLQAKALKLFCVTEGPQTVNGMTFAIRPIETARYPIDAVQAVADAHDVILPEMTVSRTELGTLVRDPVLGPELERVTRSKRSWTFRALKASGPDEARHLREGDGDES